MKKKNYIVFQLIILTFLILSISINSFASTKVLRIGHLLPVESSWHKGCEKVAEIVEERSKGELKINIYPNGQLGTQKQMIEAVEVGSLDITMAGPSLLGDYYKPLKAFDFLYIFKDYDHIQTVIGGSIGEELKEGLLKRLQ